MLVYCITFLHQPLYWGKIMKSVFIYFYIFMGFDMVGHQQ